jgi:uncharacterized protein
MARPVRLAWLLLGLLLLAAGAAAQAAGIPTLSRHATDLTGTLSAQQLDQLDAQLVALEKRKGAQLVVLMVDSTGEQDIESYSLAVAEANKVGRKGPDDGVLLLIAKNDRRVRIEVGYGLEGAIPDAAAARIIREYIAPKFRANDYYGGIHDALDALIKLIDGEQLPAPLSADEPHAGSDGVFGALVFAFMLALGARAMFGGLPGILRAVVTGGVGATAAWLLTSLALAACGLGVVGFVIGLVGAGGGGFAGGGGWGGWGGGLGGGSWGGGGFSGGASSGGGGFSGGSSGGFAGGGASGSW